VFWNIYRTNVGNGLQGMGRIIMIYAFMLGALITAAFIGSSYYKYENQIKSETRFIMGSSTYQCKRIDEILKNEAN